MGVKALRAPAVRQARHNLVGIMAAGWVWHRGASGGATTVAAQFFLNTHPVEYVWSLLQASS